MTTRIKVNLPTITTREEAESTMNELAVACNEKRLLTGRRDKEVLAVNEKYEGKIGATDQAIRSLTDTIRSWAEANPDQFPKGVKSLKLTSGTLGFRTGMPKLCLLSRAFNWERVLCLVDSFWPNLIRIKREVDKEGLIAMHNQATDKAVADAELKRCGVKVVQEESFFVDPDLTQFETRQVIS